MIEDDPIIAEIRKIREEHAAKFNYDIHAIFEDIRHQQRESGRTYVSLPPCRIEPSENAPLVPPLDTSMPMDADSAVDS